MSKVLVTGGSGFIGTNIVQHYCDRGDSVLNIDIAAPRNKAHSKFWKQSDMLNKNALISTVQEYNPDYIFHMAARTDIKSNEVNEYPINTLGIDNLIEAIKGISNLKRVVFASSRLVCKIGYLPKDEFDYCPTTAYGKSKVVGERIVREKCDDLIPWVIVRPASMWGPWFEEPYIKFFKAIKRGFYVHPKGLRIRKSYGFVGNTVFQLHKLANCSADIIHSKTLYLADYPPTEVKQWAEMIQTAMGVKPIKEIPLSILKMGAIGGDILRCCGVYCPSLSSYRLNNLTTEMVHDLKPLEKICGDLPYNLEEGVKITVDWMQ